MEAIGDVLATTDSGVRTSTAGAALSQEEFFSIMISELVNQDPLEPLDNQEFMNQLVQMQTLQAMNSLNEGIESLLIGQQISSAGALIGQTVVAEGSDGSLVQGVVDRVIVESGKAQLGIGERQIPLDAVTQVLGAPADEPGNE